MNEPMVLGKSFPEIFRQPINVAQALDESGLDAYQQEQYKANLFSQYTPGEYE